MHGSLPPFFPSSSTTLFELSFQHGTIARNGSGSIGKVPYTAKTISIEAALSLR